MYDNKVIQKGNRRGDLYYETIYNMQFIDDTLSVILEYISIDDILNVRLVSNQFSKLCENTLSYNMLLGELPEDSLNYEYKSMSKKTKKILGKCMYRRFILQLDMGEEANTFPVMPFSDKDILLKTIILYYWHIREDMAEDKRKYIKNKLIEHFKDVSMYYKDLAIGIYNEPLYIPLNFWFSGNTNATYLPLPFANIRIQADYS